MKAFHNDKNIKDKYMSRIEAHIRADELIKGKYWEHGKGCAVGCTIHSSDHGLYETEMGIPRILARLEDDIFEGLPNNLAKTWPKRFLKAIKVGADLSNVWPQFAHWLMLDGKYGVIQLAKTKQQKEAIQRVGDLYQAKSQGLVVDIEDWRLARGATYAAAYAAYAAYAAATYAANAAAYAAATYAANAAAYATYAAAAAKRYEWRTAQSEKLLELLRDAK